MRRILALSTAALLVGACSRGNSDQATTDSAATVPAPPAGTTGVDSSTLPRLDSSITGADTARTGLPTDTGPYRDTLGTDRARRDSGPLPGGAIRGTGAGTRRP